MSWQKEKRRKLGLDVNTRRKEYSCGRNYVRLDDIPTWHQQWEASSQRSADSQPAADCGDSCQLADKVSLFVGDITKLELDAIVNAANNSLLGGGGVDGAIHRAAGPNLRKENQTLRGCPDGEARISCGYNLPAKYVISTVGPRGEYPEVLGAAYRNCLALMLEHNLRTVAFPCISTGIYGYPNASAAKVALTTVRNFLDKHHQAVDRIIFCLFLEVDVGLYERMMPQYFPVLDPGKPAAANGKAEQEEVPNNGEPAAETGPPAATSPAGQVEADEAKAANESSAGGALSANQDIGEEVTSTNASSGGILIANQEMEEQEVPSANESACSAANQMETDEAAVPNENLGSKSPANQMEEEEAVANEKADGTLSANQDEDSMAAANEVPQTAQETPKRRKQE